MPTYEYRCGKCEHEFEEFQSITADPLESCPECGGLVERLISAGNGLIFKGSGFYITDYKNSGNGAATTETKKDSTSESKSEKKTTKSEKKSGES